MEELNDITKTYLRPETVAEIMGYTKQTLATYRSRGHGGPPWIKVRSRILYPVKDFKKWIKDEQIELLGDVA